MSDVTSFLNEYKGKTVQAIVEHVRDGGSVRARLLLGEKQHQMCWVIFSGIKVPSLRPFSSGANATASTEPEPFAAEAYAFVESRLLQREVSVTIEDVAPGANASGSILASVVHPVGNIAHFLLKEGLAKVHDWTAALVTGGAQTLRAAEQYAKDRSLRLWIDHKPSIIPGGTISGTSKRFTGVVIKVMGPDQLVVRPNGSSEDQKLFLASVRAPKRTGDDEVWYAEARERIRSKAIGRVVNVVIDYVRPADAGFDARTCATISLPPLVLGGSSLDLAEDLVSRGLAFVQRPRRGDEDMRSSNLDALIAAEMSAQEEKKGIHSGKAPKAPRINDVSENAAKAKQFLPFLQRQKRIPAVVDHVVNGSRLRVLIPRESAKLAVVLSGVRVPRQGEAGSSEALNRTTDLAIHRDVQLEVDAVDKTGAFIATVFIPSLENDEGEMSGGKKWTNLGLRLVQEGIAQVHAFSAEQSSYGAELMHAEQLAKSNRRGVRDHLLFLVLQYLRVV
jgi:staphylococcal nuclease domain-containing protein 1